MSNVQKSRSKQNQKRLNHAKAAESTNSTGGLDQNHAFSFKPVGSSRWSEEIHRMRFWGKEDRSTSDSAPSSLWDAGWGK